MLARLSHTLFPVTKPLALPSPSPRLPREGGTELPSQHMPALRSVPHRLVVPVIMHAPPVPYHLAVPITVPLPSHLIPAASPLPCSLLPSRGAQGDGAWPGSPVTSCLSPLSRHRPPKIAKEKIRKKRKRGEKKRKKEEIRAPHFFTHLHVDLVILLFFILLTRMPR